nr:MAG TPA: hypothetical protein [Caudoviricetes sp.]
MPQRIIHFSLPHTQTLISLLLSSSILRRAVFYRVIRFQKACISLVHSQPVALVWHDILRFRQARLKTAKIRTI